MADKEAEPNPGEGNPRLDWSTAKVRDGKLTISLDGELPSGWGKSFDAVAHLLNHGDWTKIKLKKQEVRVEGLRPGDEDKLRHFLESVVLQANADHEPSDALEGDDNGADDDGPGDGKSEEDAEMADRFRGFAEPSSESK